MVAQDDFCAGVWEFFNWYVAFVQAVTAVPDGTVDPMNVTQFQNGIFDGKQIGIPLTSAEALRMTRCEYVEWPGWLPMFLVPISQHGLRGFLCIDARTEIPPLGPDNGGYARILTPYPASPGNQFRLMSWPLQRTVQEQTPQGALIVYTYGGGMAPYNYRYIANGQIVQAPVPVPVAASLVFVRTQCPSTKKPVLLKVPPQTMTVREGLAWTFDVDVNEYQPVEET